MNTFGRNFAVTTFGESHGPAVGAVIDGCPAQLELSAADIQPLLDRRRRAHPPSRQREARLMRWRSSRACSREERPARPSPCS